MFKADCKILLIFLIILMSNTIYAKNLRQKKINYTHPKNLPLLLTIKESQRLIRNHWFHFGQSVQKSMDQSTQEAIDGGEKLLSWIKSINLNRDTDHKIRLTAKNLRRGIPIDSPSKYGPKTITKSLQNLKESLPEEISNVIYFNSKITNKIPTGLTEQKFIKNARKISKLYQTAVRWTTSIEPWLSWYSTNKRKDVRGFYHLNKVINLNQKLKDFSILNIIVQKEITKNLIGICQNSFISKKLCERKIQRAIKSNSLLKFKNKYIRQAKKMWQSYFKISNPRSDVTWNSSNPSLMIIPFKQPSEISISDWLKINVEDEYKTSSWHMELNYNGASYSRAFLKFKKGVTPHVTGGNTIVMDKNTPIDEYEVKWTIRHEFGHILRFPDCYVEFYDQQEELAINYQLDTKNLMCSRAGDFNQDNFNELKRVYFKNN